MAASTGPFHQNWEKEARSVLAGFLHAETTEEMIPFIIPISDAEALLATHTESPEILDESLSLILSLGLLARRWRG